MQQAVVEFKKRSNFWRSQLGTTTLNERIDELNRQGWEVLSVTPNSDFFGCVQSYSLLLQKGA